MDKFLVLLKAAFIGLGVFLVGLLSQPFAFLGAIVSVLADWSEGMYREWARQKSRERQIRSWVKKVRSCTLDILDEPIEVEKTVAQLKMTLLGEKPAEIVEGAIETHLDAYNGITKRDALYVSILFALQAKRKSEGRILFDDEIGQIIDRYFSLEEEFEDFKTSVNEFMSKLNEKDEFSFDRELRRHCSSARIVSSLKLELDSESETKRILKRLIKEGQISQSNLFASYLSRKEIPFSIEATELESFLILSNQMKGKTPPWDDVLSPYRYFDFGGKKFDGHYFNVTLLTLPKGMWTSDKIIDEIFRPPFVVNDELKGFLGIQRIGEEGFVRYPKEPLSHWSDKTKKGFESLPEHKKTGKKSASIADETKLVEEILSILPLNIFIPNVKQRHKNFIESGNASLRRTFGVQKLSDWANVQMSDLAQALIELDEKQKAETNDGKGSRIARDDKVWEELAENIVEQAKIHRDALQDG